MMLLLLLIPTFFGKGLRGGDSFVWTTQSFDCGLTVTKLRYGTWQSFLTTSNFRRDSQNR
jgi:hypothetical protein